MGALVEAAAKALADARDALEAVAPPDAWGSFEAAEAALAAAIEQENADALAEWSHVAHSVSDALPLPMQPLDVRGAASATAEELADAERDARSPLIEAY